MIELTNNIKRIALDFDGTYTAYPALWDMFIYMVKDRGIEIKFVTFRYETENHYIEDVAKKHEMEIIYTSRMPKRDFYDADIWVDDYPETILMNIKDIAEFNRHEV